MTKEELLTAFAEFTDCCFPICNWVFTGDWEIVRTDCPYPDFFMRLFRLEKCKKVAEGHMGPGPLVVTVGMVVSWICVGERGGDADERIYVKGPFFGGHKDEAGVTNIMKEMRVPEDQWGRCRREFWKMPMVTQSSVQQMSLMLCYAVIGEKITVEDIAYADVRVGEYKFRGRVTADQFDRSSGRWDVEQEIVNRVRRGDPDMAALAGRLHTMVGDPLMTVGRTIEFYRQNILMLLTLISRAAVEGGYPQKSSFSLSADYRRMINACASIQELTDLSDEMLLEYARRVRRTRNHRQCSSKIRLCCEYIDTHPEEKITLELLSEKTGYTVYYLSRKFKEEMNCSIVDYIRRSKLEHAKQLLVTTKEDVESISSECGFGSRSYFSSVFRKEMGETPTEYRRRHEMI